MENYENFQRHSIVRAKEYRIVRKFVEIALACVSIVGQRKMNGLKGRSASSFQACRRSISVSFLAGSDSLKAFRSNTCRVRCTVISIRFDFSSSSSYFPSLHTHIYIYIYIRTRVILRDRSPSSSPFLPSWRNEFSSRLGASEWRVSAWQRRLLIIPPA